MFDPIMLDEIRGITKEEISRGVKSVQRGIATVAGNITIQTVDINKAVVLSVSKGSEGYVAARGSIAPIFNNIDTGRDASTTYLVRHPSYGANTATGNLSGGTTDLTVKQYSAKLVNATTLSCDGPVEWQVIEYR